MGLGNRLLCLLYPPRCPFCGRVTPDGAPCPSCAEELSQTPQAARIGQKWLEKGDAAITDYGLIRRKDGGLLPHFQPRQERQIQQRRGGMEMR